MPISSSCDASISGVFTFVFQRVALFAPRRQFHDDASSNTHQSRQIESNECHLGPHFIGVVHAASIFQSNVSKSQPRTTDFCHSNRIDDNNCNYFVYNLTCDERERKLDICLLKSLRLNDGRRSALRMRLQNDVSTLRERITSVSSVCICVLCSECIIMHIHWRRRCHHQVVASREIYWTLLKTRKLHLKQFNAHTLCSVDSDRSEVVETHFVCSTSTTTKRAQHSALLD